MSRKVSFLAAKRTSARTGDRSAEAIFGVLAQMANGVVSSVGSHCEVVVHDLRDLDRSPMLIAGNVTGRAVNCGPTDFLLGKINSNDYSDMLNYRTYTDDGKILRSSTIFLREGNGQPIAAVCINVDVTSFNAVQGLIERILSVDGHPAEASNETFAKSVEETVRITVAEIAAGLGKNLRDMTRTDRIRLIEELDTKGLFQMKRAVPLVAAQLGVSRYTVYTYIQKVRSAGSYDDEYAA